MGFFFGTYDFMIYTTFFFGTVYFLFLLLAWDFLGFGLWQSMDMDYGTLSK